ncbi:MAG: hypothetical protein CUN56_14980 [Phototrophicales bacterium]|nr:MAG: hypothetical protein CUN56_14980 [Phototrophicales bacterium]
MVQRLVSLGLAARNNNQVDGKTEPIGVRQPLGKALFYVRDGEETVVQQYAELIKAELNVKAVDVLQDAGRVAQYVLNPLPQKLGPKLGKAFPKVQKLLKNGNQTQIDTWAKTLQNGDAITLEVDGQAYEITNEECEVKFNAEAGFTVAEERGYIAALDTTLTPALIKEGLAREIVRRVQSLRKEADFNIEDRIELLYTATGQLAEAAQEFADYIKEETLATSMAEGNGGSDYHTATFTSDKDVEKLGGELTISVKRVLN